MKTTNTLTRLAGCLLVIFILSTAVAQAQVQPDLFQLVLKSDYKGLSDAIVKGEDVNRATKVGNTALMSAAKIGDFQTIQTLLKHDADVNKQNAAGATALMIAAKYGHNHVISELLKYGADPKIKTHRGYTAAIFALGYQHKDIYDQLVKAEKKSIALK